MLPGKKGHLPLLPSYGICLILLILFLMEPKPMFGLYMYIKFCLVFIVIDLSAHLCALEF